ncbi:rRNA 2'-O-methyltransferase fibrillarin-like isoform X1 [Drosophila subpulchrella]|uniref:rRNA 2'-O-methyltransferase fibrillarin-like isoform X1 n=1 Tax=Drosophila subpulchrella TaxID=1486046 RepID=UPI0018A16049|nr:rRNA 2'-O-methyltransferase fibrillarin-like isoform X1 [Drosophila subpulchrella]XP_037712722.1 rRNA 2'-O-methyltransferase fibrillarin-like isoform X1 [Drosophila subpulchrella]
MQRGRGGYYPRRSRGPAGRRGGGGGQGAGGGGHGGSADPPAGDDKGARAGARDGPHPHGGRRGRRRHFKGVHSSCNGRSSEGGWFPGCHQGAHPGVPAVAGNPAPAAANSGSTELTKSVNQ